MNKFKNQRIKILTKMLEESTGKKVVLEKLSTNNIQVGDKIEVYYQDIHKKIISIVTKPPYEIAGTLYVDFYRKAYGLFYIGTATWENNKWVNHSGANDLS